MYFLVVFRLEKQISLCCQCSNMLNKSSLKHDIRHDWCSTPNDLKQVWLPLLADRLIRVARRVVWCRLTTVGEPFPLAQNAECWRFRLVFYFGHSVSRGCSAEKALESEVRGQNGQTEMYSKSNSKKHLWKPGNAREVINLLLKPAVPNNVARSVQTKNKMKQHNRILKTSGKKK